MSIQLPAPIDRYFSMGNEPDIFVIDQCFASDGVVCDGGRNITGIPAIKAWRESALAKYRFKTEPLSMTAEGSNTIVLCRVTGHFPGSPATLIHTFQISSGRIISLEIR